VSTTRSLFRNKKLPVRALLASGAALGLGTMLTFAAFTDDGQVSADFATGTVDIAFDGGNEGTATPYDSKLKMENAQIGSTVYAPLLVHNKGSLPFSYTAIGSLDEGSDTGLAEALQIRVTTVSRDVNCVAGAFTDELAVSVADIANLILPVSAVLYPVSDGVPNGDRYCFEVTLPGSQSEATEAANNAIDNDLQGTEADITFDFLATQLTES